MREADGRGAGADEQRAGVGVGAGGWIGLGRGLSEPIVEGGGWWRTVVMVFVMRSLLCKVSMKEGVSFLQYRDRAHLMAFSSAAGWKGPRSLWRVSERSELWFLRAIMLSIIHDFVCAAIMAVIKKSGDAGLIKLASLSTLRFIPIGQVLSARHLFKISK